MVATFRRAWAAAAAIERVAILLVALVVGAAAMFSVAVGLLAPALLPGGGVPPTTLPSGWSGGWDASRGAALVLGPPAPFLAFLGGMVTSFSDVDFRSLLQRDSLLNTPRSAPTVIMSEPG